MWDTFLARTGLRRDTTWLRTLLQWLAVSFIFHLIASIRSSGFYHADEHFKILEFINFRLGKSPYEAMPPDYQLHTAPWLLPALYALVGRVLDLLGVGSPFEWATTFRTLASAMGLVSLAALMLTTSVWFSDKKARTTAVILACGLWFVPALHARPAGENWAASAFILGLCTLLLFNNAKPKTPDQPAFTHVLPTLVAGFWLGLSIQFHFEMTWAVLGLMVWLGLIARFAPVGLGLLGGGITLAFALGAVADRWGYGMWVFPFKQFVAVGFVPPLDEGAIAKPWFNLFEEIALNTWPILGWVAFTATLAAWARTPKHVLTFATLPLFVWHVVRGPHELRYLFPVAACLPILLALAASPLSPREVTLRNRVLRALQWDRLRAKLKFNRWGHQVPSALLGLNVIALVLSSVSPAWLPIQFFTYLYKNRPYGFELYYVGRSPYQVPGGEMYFYEPENMSLRSAESFGEIVARLKQDERPAWVFHTGMQLPAEAAELKPWCKVDYALMPRWIERVAYRGPASAEPYVIFKCKGPDWMKSTLDLGGV